MQHGRLEEVGDHGGGELVEVPEDRSRLLRRLGPLLAQGVGLPHHVHQLGQPAVDPVLHPPGDAGPLAQQRGHVAEGGQQRRSHRLGRMGGEHRPQLEVLDDCRQQGRVGVGGNDAVDGLGQVGTGAARGVAHGQVAVHLLTHVGQVQPRGERAHQPDGVGDVDRGQEGGQRLGADGGRLPQGPDLGDEADQVRALLAAEGSSRRWTSGSTSEVPKECGGSQA